MTRKDYIIITAALKRSKPTPDSPGATEQWLFTVAELADALAADNKAFSYPKFLGAAGVS